MNKLTVALVFIAIVISGCSSTGKSKNPDRADQISCDKNQSAGSPVSGDVCEQINEKIQEEMGLKEARVGFDLQGQGRLQVTGRFKNEDDVARVFAIAQSMVGSQWLLPLKAGHIEVESWQECPQEKIAGRECGSWPAEPNAQEKMPPGPVRKRYALVVGVGRFKQNLRPLSFAANDAQSFAAYLTDPALGNFPKANVTLLTDQQAGSQAIQTALEDIEDRVQKNDLVVVYISSYGAPPNMFGHVNILTYDTEVLFGDKNAGDLSSRDKVLQRQALWNSSIPHSRLHEFFVNMAGKGVKRVLMVLDVCYSGDVWNEFPGLTPSASEELAKSEQSYATGYSAEQLMQIPVVNDPALEQTPGTVVQPTDKRYNQQLLDPKKDRNNKNSSGWGQVIISASNEGEQSWKPDSNSDPGIDNSYFTHYFLENMRQSGGHIQDSYNASIPQVAAKVMQIAQKSQQPQVFAAPDQYQWNFALGNRLMETSGEVEAVPRFRHRAAREPRTIKAHHTTKAISVIEPTRGTKAFKAFKAIKPVKETKLIKAAKPAKEAKPAKQAKPTNEARTIKAAKPTKETKAIKETRSTKENKVTKNTKETKATKVTDHKTNHK